MNWRQQQQQQVFAYSHSNSFIASFSNIVLLVSKLASLAFDHGSAIGTSDHVERLPLSATGTSKPCQTPTTINEEYISINLSIYLSFVCFHCIYCFSYRYSLTCVCLFQQSLININNVNTPSIKLPTAEIKRCTRNTTTESTSGIWINSFDGMGQYHRPMFSSITSSHEYLINSHGIRLSNSHNESQRQYL